MGLFKPNVEKLNSANDIAGLKKCLDHKNSDVRYAAFSSLANRTDLADDLVVKLKSMLNDRSPKVRTIATLKFAGSDDNTTAENLKEIINNGSQQEKIDLLRIIAARYKSPDINVNILHVIAIALLDRNELVKLKAIQTAAETGSSHFIPNLRQCLHDRLSWVRINAAKALYKIGGAGSIDSLIGLLVDRDPEVQRMAQSYLALIDSERARAALHDLKFRQLVGGMNGVESVRRDTAVKIGAQKIREGLPLLYTALKDEYKEVRIAALRAIAEFRDPSSVEFVSRVLEDKYYDARLEAVRTLGQIISRDSLKALENALEKGDRNVREEAQNAIYKLRARI